VTGNATEMQVLLSVKTYIEHSELLLLSLNNLFHLFKFSHCRDQRTALEVLAMAPLCQFRPLDRQTTRQ